MRGENVVGERRPALDLIGRVGKKDSFEKSEEENSSEEGRSA